jgi:Zn-dependent protease
MTPTRQRSIHLFRFSGIDVYLHWSWFLVAIYQLTSREGRYTSFIWSVLEYLTLFSIVLMHEFGHSLACRQVGGQANQIVLWPLGGVAYVAPPLRPGATLWSIAAGPLVNVVLFPIFSLIWFLGHNANISADAHEFVFAIWFINTLLLCFNLMPVYPLDGGQILRSLLWFMVGRARSLMIATIIGFIGVAGLLVVAVLSHQVWLGIISVFILLNCWGGLQHARILIRISKLPRRPGYRCPECKGAPPLGEFWRCSRCGGMFDTFTTQAMCPHCQVYFGVTQCLDCGEARPISEWMDWSNPPPPLPPVYGQPNS